MLVVPTGFTAEKESELLSIVARYKSGELPRRDVQFLEDVKSILVKGMGLVAARGARRSKRDAMVENLTRASEATDRPGDVVAQALMDMEHCLGAGVIADMFIMGLV